MRVNSQGWIDKSYEVTFTDGQGLTHDLYGVKEVAVSDIPKTINAPMYGFQNDHYLGERYMDKPDGTQGDLIKEGDTVVKGENMARLVNGKWTPVKIPNPACGKELYVVHAIRELGRNCNYCDLLRGGSVSAVMVIGRGSNSVLFQRQEIGHYKDSHDIPMAYK
jgi:hypothetical protein